MTFHVVSAGLTRMGARSILDSVNTVCVHMCKNTVYAYNVGVNTVCVYVSVKMVYNVSSFWCEIGLCLC